LRRHLVSLIFNFKGQRLEFVEHLITIVYVGDSLSDVAFHTVHADLTEDIVIHWLRDFSECTACIQESFVYSCRNLGRNAVVANSS
jgi:hypothetical protein